MVEKYSYTNWFKTVTSVGLVGIGLYLLIQPNSSLTLLTVVIGATIMISGFNDIAESKENRSRTTSILFGCLYILAGILIILIRNITVKTLAIFGGLYLIVHGGWRCYSSLKGRREGRFTNSALGIASVAVGIASLSWPNITIFILAVIFGGRTIFYGGTLGWSVYRAYSRNR